jgi:N-acetylglutamate synthase-like GNAT family acetyltransferase
MSSPGASLPFVIRRARRADQLAIRAFIERERLDPNNLHWRNFVVAVADGRVVGTAQLREVPGGLCELGSLAVAPELRGRGIASRLIEQLLAEAEGPIEMITSAKFAARYERFGFRRIGRTQAPEPVRRRYLIGQFLGGLRSLLNGYRPRRLAILQREG